MKSRNFMSILIAVVASLPAVSLAQEASLTYMGSRNLATGLQFGGTSTGGISGLAYEEATGG